MCVRGEEESSGTMMGEDAVMAGAASSECSSGCQSGWTTYLDDDSSSYSRGTGRLHVKGQRCRSSYLSEEAEEDDLSMISDASSGPRHQCSAGSDEGAACALANAQRAERRCRAKEPAAARRPSKMVAAVASTLLEDTASSPAFFKHSKQVMCSPEANGYGGAAGSAMQFSNAADFSSSFFSTTGFESPLSGSPLGSYLQVQYSPAPAPAPAKPPMPTRQACRDGGDKMERWW